MPNKGIKETIAELHDALDALECIATEVTEQHLEELKENAYQKGLEDAWELTKKLRLMTHFERGEALDCEPIIFDEILKMPVAEVMEKVEDYEQKAEKTEFKVGEVVIHKNGTKGLAIKVHESLVIVYVGGQEEAVEAWRKENCISTGHFLEVGDV